MADEVLTARRRARRPFVASLLLLAACGTSHLAPPPSKVLPGWRAALDPAQVASIEFVPNQPFVCPEPTRTTLVVVDPNRRRGGEPWSEAQRTAVVAFVKAGGRLVLFGHAAHLVADLGIESEMPECTNYRWGYDGRSLEGTARLGLRVVSGHLPELFEGLPTGAGDNSYFLTGGAPCSVPLCGWSIGDPRQGEVLARLVTVQDGVPEPTSMPVLLHWTSGSGEVLVCGLLPDIDHADELVRDTARGFVQRCLRAGGNRRVCIFTEPDREPAPVRVTAASWSRTAPLLAHWGWRVALDVDGDAMLRTPEELLDGVMNPSWLGGADVVELELADGKGRLPLAWNQDDPIRRPGDYRGGAAAPWSRQTFARMAAEAHGRGMLMFGSLDPLPVDAHPTECLVALRFVARELADMRRLGSGAFDGFGVRQWWRDVDGYGMAMLQDYQPAGILYRLGERAPTLAGGLRALDADDGAPRGTPWAGLTDRWRAGFPADDFPVGVLDARAERDPRDVAVRGGTSDASWIVTQANDFIRERAGRGGTLLWRRQDPRTLGPDTAAYVQGISLEPLRAAVAMAVGSGGSDGRRAASAARMPKPPAGFGAEVDEPSAVHVLQNNWFRLSGSGGKLRYDPTGMARFDANSILLSPSLMRTRLFGGRPAATAVRSERVDLLGTRRRGEGDYEAELRVGGASADRSPPAMLAHDETPTWPSAVVFEWNGTPGYHELELLPRAVRSNGVLSVSLDGVVLRCVPFRFGDRAEPVIVPVHNAKAGQRYLRVEVLEGGAVALDRLELRRAGDVGVEAEVVVPAGSRAELAEISGSSYHAERVGLTAIADQPGFVMRFTCSRAVRNLQIERTFTLPGRELAATTDGEAAASLRRPFVLRAASGSAPDLVIAPLLLGRYDRMQLRGDELVLQTAPEAGSENCFGFLMVPAGTGVSWLPHASIVLTTAERPLPLTFGTVGEGSLVSDVPMPWSRLVLLTEPPSTPFLVRENGWWSWRGTQPAPSGGSWLRVVQMPGDTVQVVAGPAVFARTHPGPGSLAIVQLHDPRARSVEVRVLQPSRLTAPSVVLAEDFDEVLLDGRPWALFDGRTVFLPDRAGTYRVETRRVGGLETPHVRRTRAPLTECSYRADRRELVLLANTEPGRPPELQWTALLAGPMPKRVENGEIVDIKMLHLPDVEQQELAREGGVLIRFGNGGAKVCYGD